MKKQDSQFETVEFRIEEAMCNLRDRAGNARLGLGAGALL